jgi:hypothetical protein
VYDSVAGLSSHGGFVCGFCCVCLWWIPLQHPTDFHWPCIDARYNIICLRESHWIRIPCSPLLYRSASFNESPRHSPSVCGVFPNSLLIVIPGQIHVYPGRVICAIWINGSTIGPCVFCFWIWHIQQMKKSDVCEDDDREQLNGCTFNSVFCRTDLGI